MRRRTLGFVALAGAVFLPACKRSPESSSAIDAAAHEAHVTPPAERPLYYDRAITTADLEGRSLREMTLMRNSIYARAGNIFYKRWLDAFFRKQPWYQPTGLDEAKLSATDKQNASAIATYEAKIPKGEIARRRDALMV